LEVRIGGRAGGAADRHDNVGDRPSRPRSEAPLIAVAQQGGCRAGAFTRIGAATLAQLDAVHVVTADFGMIDHLELLGHTADGRVVREVLQP